MSAPPDAAPSGGQNHWRLLGYIAGLPRGRIVLWCYLAWYLVIAARYFDPAPAIWLNAAGISAVIGSALWLGVRQPGTGIGFWPTFRLYLTPFCVSSFSSLIKGRGFVLVFPQDGAVLAQAAGACGAFVALVILVKAAAKASRR
ncbi:MAG TPA: hypothetical protein VIN75_25905 [Burkholderiaceae bacterium]